MSTGGPETRDQQLAAQRSRLAAIQLRYQEVLEHRGIIDRAIAAAQRKLGPEWTPELGERTPNTRFVVSRGSVVKNLEPEVETLYVTRFEGDERQWGAEVGTRITAERSINRSPGFSLSDVGLVARFIDSLAFEKTKGQLSNLNFDCDRIG